MTGLTTREFAKHIGVSHQTVTNAEKNRHVRDITLKMWAMSTGVSAKWLETGEVPGPDDEPEDLGTAVVLLPWIDSNDQPSGYEYSQVNAA